jgi:hypothetical protein
VEDPVDFDPDLAQDVLTLQEDLVGPQVEEKHLQHQVVEI